MMNKFTDQCICQEQHIAAVQSKACISLVLREVIGISYAIAVKEAKLMHSLWSMSFCGIDPNSIRFYSVSAW